MKRICTKCNTEKQLDEFHYSRLGKYGKRSECKLCTKVRAKDWHLKNPISSNDRKYKHMWTRYKLDRATYDVMVSEGCNACGQFNDLHIDHDHSCCAQVATTITCGKCVRGVLCASCNKAAGYLKDSPERCEQLAEYLNKWR